MLFEATRWRCSSAAQGWKGRPSLNDAPRFQNWLVLTDSGIISFVRTRGLGMPALGRRGRSRRPLILPDSGEIRMAVRSPRRGSRKIRLAVGGLGDSGVG